MPGEEDRVERGVIIAGEEVSPPGREAVIRALNNCYDQCCQDQKISVVDMRLIEAIEIRDRKVRIENGAHERLVPVRRSALDMIREEVSGLPAVDAVDVVVA